jgi:2-desacetyl-2-hydroxyethyl bacteriochlorophyllide A dehydrogenase
MPKRIIFPEKGKVACDAFDLAKPAANEVIVRTYYSLISIGTETIILNQKYDADTHFAKMFSFPQLKTGVQAVGEIEETGSEVNEFKVGDMIFMRQAHGSHQVIPASACSPVPEKIDLKSACWCGLAKTAFRAAWAGRFELGKDVLIIGAGPVGQMAIRWAYATGVSSIAVVDMAESRLEHAVQGGATVSINKGIADAEEEVKSINNGLGPQIVVDTTGNSLVFSHALSVAGQYGKIIILGDTGYPSEQCLSSDVMTKGLTIQATHDSHDIDGWTQRRIDHLFFEQLKRQKFDLSGLITHEFSPQDCKSAYSLADENRGETMGILYDWTRNDW